MREHPRDEHDGAPSTAQCETPVRSSYAIHPKTGGLLKPDQVSTAMRDLRGRATEVQQKPERNEYANGVHGGASARRPARGYPDPPMTDFVPDNQLETLLVRAATDPAARPDFYRELVRAALFALTPNSPETEGTHTAAVHTTLSLVNMQGPGGPFTPLFTSRVRIEEAVRRIGRPMGWVGIQGGALLGMLAQHPQTAVLNPGFPYGKELTPDEIRAIADGTLLQTGARRVAAGAQVLLGQPAVYPRELVEALVRLFRERASVKAAYLAQIDLDGEMAPHPVVGIVSSDYAKDAPAAGMVAQGAAGVQAPVDFVDMGDGAGSTIVKYLRESTMAFYLRADAKAPVGRGE